MKRRTNAEWLQELRSQGQEQKLALSDLRSYLLRAALFSLNRNRGDLSHLDRAETEQLAEDAAQDALIAVLHHLDDFRAESQFTTWVYKFAVNFALVTARRELWRNVSLDELLARDMPDPFIQNGAHPATPAVAALRTEVWESLQEIMVTDLTERQRQALQAVVLEGVPLDEVARHWETNRNAVYKMLHDARRKVKAKMQARGFGWREVSELFSGQG